MRRREFLHAASSGILGVGVVGAWPLGVRESTAGTVTRAAKKKKRVLCNDDGHIMSLEPPLTVDHLADWFATTREHQWTRSSGAGEIGRSTPTTPRSERSLDGDTNLSTMPAIGGFTRTQNHSLNLASAWWRRWSRFVMGRAWRYFHLSG